MMRYYFPNKNETLHNHKRYSRKAAKKKSENKIEIQQFGFSLMENLSHISM